jgi:Macrocin-O-methyltransferase (TylF)
VAGLDSRAVNEEIADDPVGLLQDLLLRGRPAARASLAAVREPRSPGPGTEAETLRRAYLDLLKLCLCDLAGTTTRSVGSLPDGGSASRVLRDDQLSLRSAGMDWPLQGLTMIGLRRLDDLEACVESLVRDGVEGDLIEAGAWRGGASILMRATLDALGAGDRTVWVSDSFRGFPETHDRDRHEKDWSAYDFLAVPLEEVRDSFRRFGFEDGVRFLPGFFEDTLPGLGDRRWSLVRLDGDTYDATWMTLQSLYPGLSAGGYLVVDDYGALEECRRAVDEFRDHNGITETLEEIDWTGRRWRRESTEPIAPPPPGVLAPKDAATATQEPPPARVQDAVPDAREVPTVGELKLTRELAALRERLAAAEAEVRRLQGSPLRAAAARLRDRRGRGS